MNELNEMDNDQIAAALERLTRPMDAEPVLYEKALEGQTRTMKFMPLLRKPAVKIGIAAMLVLAAGSSITLFLNQSGSPVSLGRRVENYGLAPEADVEKFAEASDGARAKSVDWKDTEKWREQADAQHKSAEYRKATTSVRAPADSSTSERQVVRKAVMELQITDVRAGYMKALLLVSDASGEFVQDSALAGGDPPTSANMTLRVTTARLSTVLQQLRELGKVTSENSTGEDVTDRLVDLGARLRNEERVEKEMLDLLEKRKDSQLKDVLDVRDRLGQVRGVIEQLRAQQAAAEKSVALATILVVIRAAPEAPKPPPPVAGFGERLQIAAMDGLHSAGDSVIGLSRGAIAGLPWWTGMALCGVGILALRRRMLKQAAKEPAPAV